MCRPGYFIQLKNVESTSIFFVFYNTVYDYQLISTYCHEGAYNEETTFRLWQVIHEREEHVYIESHEMFGGVGANRVS